MIASPARLNLIDRIYECGFRPDLWPKLLDELASLVGARGSVLVTANSGAGIMRWIASERLRHLTEEYVTGGWLARGKRSSVLFGTNHAGFLTQAATTPDAWEADVDNRDFFKPHGLGWAAATMIPMPTGDVLTITVERDYALGPVPPRVVKALDALRPHLARSALLSARLQLERAAAMSEALRVIGLPAVVLGDRGRVLAANPLVDGLTDQVRWRARDRVSLADPIADALLQQAVRTVTRDAGGPIRSFAVRSPDASASLVAHVIPIRGTARDLLARCAAILVLTPVTLPAAPPVELIQSLFDLTAAEARVARSLAAGDTVGDIAQSGSVSQTTVRTQVRGILEKTGCNRQTDVVALLGGISVQRCA